MQSSRTSPFDSKLSHKIDMLCLSILFVAIFSCLIRTDYNFAIIFFVYFVWQQRQDAIALKIGLIAVVLLLVIDFIFMFTYLRVWITEDPKNPVWQTLSGMHNFGIFCFAVIYVLKIVLLIFLCKGIKYASTAVQTR